MRQNIFPLLAAAVAVITIIAGVILLGANIYGRYLRISRGKAAQILVAAVFVAIGFGIWRANVLQQGQVFFHFANDDFDQVLRVGLTALLPLAGIPFLGKLYLTWIAGATTDAEKAPGMEGVRAWLRGGNLVCAVLISICLWLGFGYSFWGPVALTVMALLAFPILNMAMTTTPSQTSAPAADTLSPERERVLKMLDDGKITAQESAELLNALGHSAQPRPAPTAAAAPHRKFVMIGLVLLVIGFFLPWFVIRVGDVQKAMSDMISQMPVLQGMPDPGSMMPANMPTGVTISVAGGNISHGLGWCVLLLGILAAALPYVAANLDAPTCQKACLIALAVGGIILVYLFTENIRFASIGILLGLAGYALEFIGVLKARELNWGRAV